MLGAMTDAEVAKKTGRVIDAVCKKRGSLKRPPLFEGPRGLHRKYWTAKEDDIVRKHPVAEAAKLLNRTEKSIQTRRFTLGITVPRPPKSTSAS